MPLDLVPWYLKIEIISLERPARNSYMYVRSTGRSMYMQYMYTYRYVRADWSSESLCLSLKTTSNTCILEKILVGGGCAMKRQAFDAKFRRAY